MFNIDPKRPAFTRTDDAPKNVNAHGLTPNQQKDWDILFGGNKIQDLIFINLPYSDHNGKVKWVVGAVYSVVRKMLPPSLPDLLPPLKSSPAYAIRDIAGKGKGVIATRDIALGEIVIIERPILIYPLTVYTELVEQFHKYAEESMNPEDWKKYNDLVNVKDSSVPKFDGIRGTNAFTIELKKGKEDYCAVFFDTSRLNHSCGPNLRRSWNPYLFTFSVQAVRPIRAGEELTVAYGDICSPRADRQFNLQRLYKFKCKCVYCTKASPISDQDRHAAQSDIASFENTYSKLMNPNLPRHTGHGHAVSLLHTLVKNLVTITKEGIESGLAFRHYVYLMKVSGLLGDKKRFKEWGFKVLLFSAKHMEDEGKEACREVERWIDWVREPEKKFPGWGRFEITHVA